MAIVYAREDNLSADEFIDVLKRSGIVRPVDDRPRIEKMLKHANLIITARDNDLLIGVSRALSDFAFCCYLSDLAVDKAFQKQGIGKRLIEETRKAAGPQSMCLLLAAPAAMSYYPAIGMPQADNAFLYQREK